MLVALNFICARSTINEENDWREVKFNRTEIGESCDTSKKKTFVKSKLDFNQQYSNRCMNFKNEKQKLKI